jgi:hypothetical protein
MLYHLIDSWKKIKNPKQLCFLVIHRSSNDKIIFLSNGCTNNQQWTIISTNRSLSPFFLLILHNVVLYEHVTTWHPCAVTDLAPESTSCSSEIESESWPQSLARLHETAVHRLDDSPADPGELAADDSPADPLVYSCRASSRRSCCRWHQHLPVHLPGELLPLLSAMLSCCKTDRTHSLERSSTREIKEHVGCVSDLIYRNQTISLQKSRESLPRNSNN